MILTENNIKCKLLNIRKSVAYLLQLNFHNLLYLVVSEANLHLISM